jgi:hypothetical protein
MVIALSAATAAVMGACASTAETDVTGGEAIGEQTGGRSTTVALTVDENTATRLNGVLRTVDGELAFSAITIDASVIQLRLVVNGRAFDATIDDAKTAIDGHDAVLTDADRALLTTFLDQFAIRFAGASAAERDLSLNRLALYISEAPQGHVHRAITRGSSEVAALGADPEAIGDEGVTCITKGARVTAVYTDKSGKVTEEAIVVGSKLSPMPGGNGDYSCMGKCGAGCKDYWFMKTGYTKDCLDHDACSRKYSSTNGAKDPNCGDEYNAASRDFTNSSRCTGN